jgi:hypothetical protein
MNNPISFKSALESAALLVRKECLKEGTVGLGYESLYSALARKMPAMPGCPKGTNAIYYAHESLREVVAENSTLRAFVLL